MKQSQIAQIFQIKSKILTFCQFCHQENIFADTVTFFESLSENSRGIALIFEASKQTVFWIKILEVIKSIKSDQKFPAAKNCLKLLTNLCKDRNCAGAWAAVGGHGVFQDLMSHQDEDVIDLVYEAISLTLLAGVHFPQKILRTDESVEEQTLLMYYISKEATGNGREFELILRPINRRQSSMSTTGFQLWNSAGPLAHWIVTNRELFYGKRVLEIGAGLGLCGIVASCFAQEVILSDMNWLVINNLSENIILNLQSDPANEKACTVALDNADSLRAVFLDWNVLKDGDIESLDESLQPNSFDIVIASDVVCQREDAEGFTNAIVHFLSAAGFAYIVVPHPNNRFGVQFLPSALQDAGLSFELSEPDFSAISDKADLEIGFKWLHFTVWNQVHMSSDQLLVT